MMMVGYKEARHAAFTITHFIILELRMPKVGGRQFGYSKKGKAAAATYAKKTGKKVTKRKSKKA